jgi:type IV fimbrial biogenesis protein FimT
LLRGRDKSAAGFTLIEMLVTMVIFGILVGLTVPSMKTWIANTRVRAVADSLQNGLRLAQAESMRRSRQVVFALTSNSPTAASPTFTASATGMNWAVVTIPLLTGETSAFIQSGVLATGASNVAVTVVNGSGAEVCFNSLGRLITQPNTGVPGGTCSVPTAGFNGDTTPKLIYEVTLNTASGQPLADRPIYVLVALGGQVHLCSDLTTLNSSSDPYGC